jgi:hypothetical protein
MRNPNNTPQDPLIVSVGLEEETPVKEEEELCDELHPHTEIAPAENKSPTKKRGRGRPPTHGLSRKPIYRSFREAKRRSTDPKHPDYHRYGGRGIEFRFDTVTDLFETIGDRLPNTTLDRINPDGHYEAGNVRWASPKEQANNRSRSSGHVQYKPPGWAQMEGAREALPGNGTTLGVVS